MPSYSEDHLLQQARQIQHLHEKNRIVSQGFAHLVTDKHSELAKAIAPDTSVYIGNEDCWPFEWAADSNSLSKLLNNDKIT